MRFRVLALDYDGTIAEHGARRPDVKDTIRLGEPACAPAIVSIPA